MLEAIDIDSVDCGSKTRPNLSSAFHSLRAWASDTLRMRDVRSFMKLPLCVYNLRKASEIRRLCAAESLERRCRLMFSTRVLLAACELARELCAVVTQ